MNFTVNNVEMTTEVCAKCAILFAVPLDFHNRRRDDHVGFYCPSGHSQWYPAKSSLEIAQDAKRKAEKQLDTLKQEKEQLEYALKNGLSTKCPKCGKYVKGLAGHMQRMHH